MLYQLSVYNILLSHTHYAILRIVEPLVILYFNQWLTNKNTVQKQKHFCILAYKYFIAPSTIRSHAWVKYQNNIIAISLSSKTHSVKPPYNIWLIVLTTIESCYCYYKEYPYDKNKVKRISGNKLYLRKINNMWPLHAHGSLSVYTYSSVIIKINISS